MRDLSYFSKIYLSIDAVDFRKQAHGLALLAIEGLDLSLNSGKVIVVFTNRRRTAVKILYWDDTGYAMWWKTLEKDRFKWPKSNATSVSMSARDLRWLLEGVDLKAIKKHEKIELAKILRVKML